MPDRSQNEAYNGKHFEEEGNAIGLTEAFAPVDEDPAPVRRGRHARHAKPEPANEAFADSPAEDFADEDEAFAEVSLGVIGAAAQINAAPNGEGSRGRHGRRRRSGADGEVPRYMKKSRRMRNILIGAIVALILLATAGAFYTWQLIEAAQDAASQSASQSVSGEQGIESEASDDAASITAKKVAAPNLVSLLGLSVDAATSQLGEGAQIVSETKLNAQGNRVGKDEEVATTELTLSLTSDASDSRMGFPSVYLVANAEGVIERAGYSTTTTLLGFGSQSFEDVIANGHIVEVTLGEAGVGLSSGSVSLPSDKAEYSAYAEDGTTLVKESCSFEGQADVGEDQVAWSAFISYDYAMYNATGNLNDTVRVIYIYVE